MGESMSQKPSAELASTGPNMRLNTKVSARMPAAAAQGKSPRPARQPAESQLDAERCASRMADPIIAPSTTTEKTIT